MRHRVLLMLAQLRLRLASVRSRLHFRFMPRQRAVLFFPLAIALTVTSIVFAARSSSNMCTPAKSVATAKTLPSQVVPTKTVPSQKLCRPPIMGPLGVGRLRDGGRLVRYLGLIRTAASSGRAQAAAPAALAGAPSRAHVASTIKPLA